VLLVLLLLVLAVALISHTQALNGIL